MFFNDLYCISLYHKKCSDKLASLSQWHIILQGQSKNAIIINFFLKILFRFFFSNTKKFIKIEFRTILISNLGSIKKIATYFEINYFDWMTLGHKINWYFHKENIIYFNNNLTIYLLLFFTLLKPCFLFFIISTRFRSSVSKLSCNIFVKVSL